MRYVTVCDNDDTGDPLPVNRDTVPHVVPEVFLKVTTKFLHRLVLNLLLTLPERDRSLHLLLLLFSDLDTPSPVWEFLFLLILRGKGRSNENT